MKSEVMKRAHKIYKGYTKSSENWSKALKLAWKLVKQENCKVIKYSVAKNQATRNVNAIARNLAAQLKAKQAV